MDENMNIITITDDVHIFVHIFFSYINTYILVLILKKVNC